MRDILFRLPLPFTDATLPIHSYGVMAMIGFLVGMAVARWRARRVGVSADLVMDMGLCALFGGIIGSRLVYVFQNADYYFDTSRRGWSLADLFKIWEGGLVFYGGFIGAFVVVIVMVRLRKQRLLAILDVMAPSVALGHAFGRIGCFLRGCCYDIPVAPDRWYGVVYPEGALPYDVRLAHGCSPGTPLFPVQIASSIGLLIIFLILSLFFKRRRGEGQVVALYAMIYSVHRFGIEFLRGDTHAPGALSPAQWTSIFTLFIGLSLFVYVAGKWGSAVDNISNGQAKRS